MTTVLRRLSRSLFQRYHNVQPALAHPCTIPAYDDSDQNREGSVDAEITDVDVLPGDTTRDENREFLRQEIVRSHFLSLGNNRHGWNSSHNYPGFHYAPEHPSRRVHPSVQPSPQGTSTAARSDAVSQMPNHDNYNEACCLPQ